MTGLLRSFGFAWSGVARAWREQRNFRVEVVIAALAWMLCWWTGASFVPVAILTAVVLGLELVNSSLEALIDLLSPSHHKQAGAAKDMAAGAVLVAAAVSLVVGVVTIAPPLGAKLGLW